MSSGKKKKQKTEGVSNNRKSDTINYCAENIVSAQECLRSHFEFLHKQVMAEMGSSMD